MNKVYTYTKITELKNAPYFTEIAALPQITMSRNMTFDMARDMRVFRNNIQAFQQFSQKMFPDWNTNGQKFTYVTVLNRYLRERIAAAKDKGERDWLFGCKKNLYSVINNILRLEEARVRPEDIAGEDRDIRIFQEMWKRLEGADGLIESFRKRMADLENPAVFTEAVNQIFRFHGMRRIIWHGFQYLTPIQQFLYDGFLRAGFEVDALIQEEDHYPYANEIWNHLYRPENGFPEKKDWIRQGNLAERNPIGELFERGEKTSAGNIRLIKYTNSIEFIEDIPRIKNEGYYIYSADDKTANSMLKDYYPERYEVRNLLSYPIGQFVYTLHRMWDENRQCIALSPNDLRKCFASGWLSAKGGSSLKYTEELERLLPYFEDCYTLDEWRGRLRTFTDSYDNAIDVFSDDGEMGNPFLHFSPFSIPEDKIDAVISIIGKLIKMAEKLFGEATPVSIHEHMSKLDALLYMPDGMSADLYQEERQKVKRIFEALESDQVKDYICYPGDLAAALLAFMNDKLDDEDEKKPDLKTLVFHIYQVEAAPIASEGKVHICLADIQKLPGSAGRFSWPLDEETLQDVIRRKPGTLLPNWLENNHLSAFSNRYYFYAALKNPKVEISWIEKQGEKLYAPSPYITLLNTLSDAKIQESDVRHLDLVAVAEIPSRKNHNQDFDIAKHADYHTYDSELIYSLCPMRFVYSYVLGGGSAYRGEYLQNRALMRLIQSLAKLLTGVYSPDAIAEQVFEIFPNIREAEKRQIKDDVASWPIPEDEGHYTDAFGARYTDYRLNLSFLDPWTYKQAKSMMSKLMSQEGRRGIFYDRGLTSESQNCEFCPHAGYCREALFGIDYRSEGL